MEIMIKKYESNHKEREEVMKEIKKRGYNDWKKKVRNKGNSEKEQRETKINREEVIKESMSGKKSKKKERERGNNERKRERKQLQRKRGSNGRDQKEWEDIMNKRKQ